MQDIKTIALIILIGLTGTFCSCKKDPPPVVEETLKITGVSVPSNLGVPAAASITLTGTGFAVNDQISFTLSSDPLKVYASPVTSVTGQSATFSLPVGITTGTYKISVTRGDESLLLGTLVLNVTVDTGIPDIQGMTVKGIVYSGGAGVPGVVVSDGYEVTVTNAGGIYYLPSQKKSGFVFISIPGNYEVAAVDNIPQFFQRLAGGSTVEQKDFSLVPANNSKHVILTMTDWHLANRNDDLSQFSNVFLPDVNSTISEYAASGSKVYGLTLGDMTWDVYWYENNFELANYLPEMKKINCMMFNTMGNHDNDPYVASDIGAEARFRNIIGPTWYSFNLGLVHYIVLDNVEYVNTGGAPGVIGDRNYNDIITTAQMDWLRKDLATVTDKSTPVIIAMHTPLYNNPSLDGIGNPVSSINLSNGNTLISALEGFTRVHIVTGHTHINYNAVSGSSIMEHNTAAVCATWWWTGKTGYAGNQVCKDGSPGGYGVWMADGRDIKWYYKSAGSTKNYQFRAYDLNKVHITAARYAPNASDADLAVYAGVYANPNLNNEVLINVWGYDPEWTVEVKEGGNPLLVTRVSAKDPLHIISYEAKRLNAGAVPTSSFVTGNTAHMFRVTAASATSTLEIRVTDRFGNVYTQTMTRPKELTYAMN